MELRDRITEMFEKSKGGLLVFAALLGFGCFINRDVELTGLYMDDLYLWSCYGEQSFMEYVFPTGGTRFRFVFYLASWLEMFFLGGHVEWMVPFNIVLNAAIAWSLYAMAVRMSGGRTIVSFLMAIAYLLSRLSYYQIGQFYGLMESLGLWAALGVLYYTWRYMREKNTVAYIGANVLYFLVSFIHERYMVLVPVLLLGLAMEAGDDRHGRKSAKGNGQEPDTDLEMNGPADEADSVDAAKQRQGSRSRRSTGARAQAHSRRQTREGKRTAKWLLLILTLAVTLSIQVIRLATIGTLSPAGTGGTDVADTFVMEDAIENAWAQVGFVFGKNSGPDYLCVMPFEDSPDEIVRAVNLANASLGLSVAAFVVCCVLEWRRHPKRIIGHVKTVVLFVAFFAMCIGSSSVTIRVEMRWVYVVYAAALLLLAYMSSITGKAAILVPFYLMMLFRTETFYRDNWDALYLWPNQLRYNSLADETIGAYGEEIFDKQVYIIGNSYEMSEFTAETFLKVYDTEGDAEHTTLKFLDSDLDLATIEDDAVILWEDPEHNAYTNVTEFVKNQRLNYAYGSYEDGWVDEHAKIVFMSDSKDTLKLGCYYPGEITGNEVCQIRVNGKRMPDLVFTENYMTYEIPSAQYQMISLEFSCNFYVKDAEEKRGEENLAMVVTLGAE